jgi:protein phosphatase
MTIIQGHEAYVANVGDSRVYRITRSGCQQITLDDDLATREVRLGYSVYRDALSTPGCGSLFQALGMTSSTSLHPTVHRMVVDEECIFLLCSDGLSDHNRVEQFWQQDVLPVLEGKIDLATAANRLITTANTRNGHDNVTVGLIHCRVKQPRETVSVPIATATTALNLTPNSTLLLSAPPSPTEPSAPNKSYVWLGVGSFLVAMAIAGVTAMRFMPPSASNPSPSTPSSSIVPSSNSVEPSTTPNANPVEPSATPLPDPKPQ